MRGSLSSKGSLAWLPISAITVAFSLSTVFLDESRFFQQSSLYQHVFILAWASLLIISLALLIVHEYARGRLHFALTSGVTSFESAAKSNKYEAMSLFKLSHIEGQSITATKNGEAVEPSSLIESLEGSLQKLRDAAGSDPSSAIKLAKNLVTLSMLYREKDDVQKSQTFKKEAIELLKDTSLKKNKEARSLKRMAKL